MKKVGCLKKGKLEERRAGGNRTGILFMAVGLPYVGTKSPMVGNAQRVAQERKK